MTWHQSHQRSLALGEIEAALTVAPLTPPRWRAEYADLFGTPARLTQFLRSRWLLRLSEPAVDDLHREHPARTLARVGLAALDLQDAYRAVA